MIHNSIYSKTSDGCTKIEDISWYRSMLLTLDSWACHGYFVDVAIHILCTAGACFSRVSFGWQQRVSERRLHEDRLREAGRQLLREDRRGGGAGAVAAEPLVLLIPLLFQHAQQIVVLIGGKVELWLVPVLGRGLVVVAPGHVLLHLLPTREHLPAT